MLLHLINISSVNKFASYIFCTSKVKECDVCQLMTKKMNTRVPELNPIPVEAIWYHNGIDFIGPLKHKEIATF